MGKDDKEINSESFLALTVKLPKEIKEELEKVQNVIKYNGSEEKHKIPHITVVGPRKTFDLNDWKEKIKEKINEKPTKFKIDSFNSLWKSSKLGFKGNLNGKADINNPHVVLFDCDNKEKAQSYFEDKKEIFEKYEGKELKIKSIAVVEKNEGVIYEEKINEDDLNFDIEQGKPFNQNEEDIKKFYNLLDHEEHTVYQIYRKDGTASQQKFFDSVDEALSVIKKNKLEGLNCFGINERKEGHTKIEDGISKINLILFDIDVNKEVRKQGVSSRKQIQEAYDVAKSVRDKLKDLGFEVDLVVFSGNGFHIGLKTNIQLSRYNSKKEWKESLYYKKLEALEDKLKDLETENVEIDSITKDIVRRVKIPGTYNVKEDIPKENYRKAKIIYLNDDIDQERNKESFHNLEAKKKQEKNVSRNKETETENKEGRPSFDKLLDLINKGKIDDPKLVDLYEGNWEGYSFKKGHSRSEAEQSLVSKLVFYDFDEVEIRRIMGNCGIGKWQEKGDSYKNNTIEYATNNQTTIADWESGYKDVEPRKNFEDSVFSVSGFDSDKLIITKEEFDFSRAFEDEYDQIKIKGINISKKAKKKLFSIIEQKEEAIYVSKKDISDLEAISVIAGELKVKGANIKAQVSDEEDLSDQVAEGDPIEIEGRDVQEILIENYEKIQENEDQLNFVDDVKELFYYSLIGMKDSDKEIWIKKLKKKMKDVDDEIPTLKTLYKEGKEFSEEKFEEITEQTEETELTEGGNHRDNNIAGRVFPQELNPKDFMDETIPDKKRLSGFINDNKYFHTVFLYREGKLRPYVITSEKELVVIKDKLEEIKSWAKRKEDVSLEDIDKEKYDYQYFELDDEKYKLRHRVKIKEDLEIYKPNNNIMVFFDEKEPKKDVFDDIRKKVKKYWDHYNDKWFDVASSFIIHTYLVMGIGYTVYLLMKGNKDTGKSTLQKTISRLAYNGFFTGSSTKAVSSRIAHILQATINQDEFEKLNDQAQLEIQGVYNTGQRKGGKYTFTNTNKSDIADQIEVLYSFCPKTLSTNSLYGFENSFLSRNIIIETTKTSRSLSKIENMDKEEKREFQELRNEISAYTLFNHDEIINDIEEYRDNLSISGRKSDKIGLICGLIKHFKGKEKAKKVKDHLKSTSAIQNEDINNRTKVALEYIIDKFDEESKSIKVKPKEIADHVNNQLNIDDEYKATSKSVGNKLRDYSILRDESQVSRGTTGRYVYSISRKKMLDALSRYELYDLQDQLTTKEDEPDNPDDEDKGEGEKKDNPNNPGSVSSVSSVSSEKNQKIDLSKKTPRDRKKIVKNFIGEEIEYEDLLDKFVDNSALEETINNILGGGDYFEPKPGKIKKL